MENTLCHMVVIFLLYLFNAVMLCLVSLKQS